MDQYRNIFEDVFSALHSARRVVLVAHQGPDADTLGSILACSMALEQMGKVAIPFCKDPVPVMLGFLPGIERLTTDPNVFSSNVDIILVCDAGDLGYAGIEEEVTRCPQARIINIDHHATNARFGHINLVIPDASSSTTILHQLLALHDLPITKAMATNLLVGIIYDTGNFSNAATTLHAFEAASHLLKRGARIPFVVQHMVRNKNLQLLRLWGRALSRLRKDPNTGFATTAIFHQDFSECGVTEQSFEGLPNFLNSLEGVSAVMVLKENGGGRIKGSLRTTGDEIDVAKIAQQYGGNGHRRAAGFVVQGTIVERPEGWDVRS
jgi:phosphoesterase RecJ-like protein